MSYDSLRKAQRDNSEAVANLIVAPRKGRFLIGASLIAGIVFWLVMNALFLTRYHASLKGRYLAGSEAVGLLISMLFGFIIGLRLWRHFKGLEKSDRPQ